PCLGRIEFLLHLALTVEKLVHLIVGHGLREFRIDFIVFPKQIYDRLHALFDDFTHRLFRIELRLLLEKSDRVARGNGRLALKILIDGRENAEQRALSRTVQSNDSDLRAVEVRKVDVFEDSFLVVILADPDHGVDNFVWYRAHYLVGKRPIWI